MVVNNQQMQMGEDRPISIGEMDFEFLTKGDPATDIQDAAGRMAENLKPEEQKEIAGLVPYVERFFILSHKAETGEFPPEPEFAADGGVSIDDYRSMSGEEQIANSMEGRQVNLGVARKSSFDKSPSGLPQPIAVESPEVQGPPAPQQEAEMQEGGEVEEEVSKKETKGKETIPAGPVGEVDVAGKDNSGVADDVRSRSDGFVLSKGAVVANGKMYIMQLLNEAIESLKEKGKEVDTNEVPQDAEEILVSNGEILIPDIIAQEIGYKRLEKINKRGEELTEKLIAEYQAGQQQQPQPQIKAPFEQAPKKTAFKEAKQSFS